MEYLLVPHTAKYWGDVCLNCGYYRSAHITDDHLKKLYKLGKVGE